MTESTPLAFRQQGEGWHLNPRRKRWLQLGLGTPGRSPRPSPGWSWWRSATTGARAVRVGPTMPDDVVRNWLTFETHAPDGDRLTLFSGSQSPSVPVEVLGTDPTLTLEICRHYLDRPADRAELASPSVAQRWL